MLASHFLLFAAAACVSATLQEDEHFISALLKRQEPGTPEYNCHDNCGQAIIISRGGGDICSNDAFLTDYKNCLQCAGPDNVDIWKFYGNTLSKAASGCGLETTPLSGKQADVGPAIPAGGAASATPTPSSTPTPTPSEIPSSAASSPEASAPTSAAPVPTSAAPVPTSQAPVSTPEVSQSTAVSIESPTVSTPSVAITPSGSGVPTSGANGTTSFTASLPPQQTTNAASGIGRSNVAGFLGVIAIGMAYGFN